MRRRATSTQDAPSSAQAQSGSTPQINGITPQIGHLPGQAAPSKAQKAGLHEASLHANGIQLQSHG